MLCSPSASSARQRAGAKSQSPYISVLHRPTLSWHIWHNSTPICTRLWVFHFKGLFSHIQVFHKSLLCMSQLKPSRSHQPYREGNRSIFANWYLVYTALIRSILLLFSSNFVFTKPFGTSQERLMSPELVNTTYLEFVARTIFVNACLQWQL